MDLVRQLSLVKGEHRYVFRYQAGREADIIGVFAEMAADSQRDFDWFDAAVLSFKLTQSLIGQADEILSDKTNAQIQKNECK